MKKLTQAVSDLPTEDETTEQTYFRLALNRIVVLLDTVRAIGWASLMGLIALGVMVVVFSVQVNKYVAAQDRSDRLNACRSSYNAELVSAPTAEGLKAAAVFGLDSPELQVIVTEDMDTTEFKRLAKLSATDPDAFLEECAEDNG